MIHAFLVLPGLYLTWFVTIVLRLLGLIP